MFGAIVLLVCEGSAHREPRLYLEESIISKSGSFQSAIQPRTANIRLDSPIQRSSRHGILRPPEAPPSKRIRTHVANASGSVSAPLSLVMTRAMRLGGRCVQGSETRISEERRRFWGSRRDNPITPEDLSGYAFFCALCCAVGREFVRRRCTIGKTKRPTCSPRPSYSGAQRWHFSQSFTWFLCIHGTILVV